MGDAIQLEFDFSKDDKITISKTIEQSDIDNELLRYSPYNDVSPKNLMATQYLIDKFLLVRTPLTNRYKLSLIGLHERSLAEKRLESVGR